MKTRTQIINCLAVYAVFAAMLLALNGCQAFKQDATARDKYADAERSYQVAVDTAATAYRSGKLKGETLIVVKAALIEANGALIEMNARLKAGDTIEADYWIGRVMSAVNAALQYLSAPAPTTTQG